MGSKGRTFSLFFAETVPPTYNTFRWDCVILLTNRAKCELNKEILDLINEESVSRAFSRRASL